MPDPKIVSRELETTTMLTLSSAQGDFSDQLYENALRHGEPNTANAHARSLEERLLIEGIR